MADEEHESIEWEEVEVTESLPIDEGKGLSLEDSEYEEWDEAEDRERDDPYASSEDDEDSEASGLEVFGEDEDDSIRITPRTILEAILFVGTPNNEPQTSDRIAALMRGVRADEIDDLVAEINEEYEEQQAAFEIVSDSGGYRLALREEYQSVKMKFYGRIKEARLSQAAIDVLAIVAYRQPVSREEVDQLRGRASGGLLNQLVRRRLVTLEISGERPKRRTFRTSERFLQLFGMSDLSELPKSQDE